MLRVAVEHPHEAPEQVSNGCGHFLDTCALAGSGLVHVWFFMLYSFVAFELRRYSGILNGIDIVLWDPATDPALPVGFTGGITCFVFSCQAWNYGVGCKIIPYSIPSMDVQKC